MTSTGRPLEPEVFAIQLEDVYCVLAHAERRDKSDGETEAPKGARIALSSTELGDDKLHFRSRLEVSVAAPVLDQEMAELTVTVQGNYAGQAPIDADVFEAFTRFTPMVQLYPYVRSYLAELGHMIGVALPPLPLITVGQPPSDDDLEVEGWDGPEPLASPKG